MADRTQQIRDLEDALNTGILEVRTGETTTRFANPEDLRRRLRELKAEQDGKETRPVAASLYLGGF